MNTEVNINIKDLSSLTAKEKAIFASLINNQTERVVSARELYRELGLDSSSFNRWIDTNLIEMYEEGKDYVNFLHNADKSKRGRPSKDFALTLDTAKHLSMLARTPQGKIIRQYFIDVEKKANKPMSPYEQLVHNAQMLLELERKQKADKKELKEDIRLLETTITNQTHHIEYYTIAGYYSRAKKITPPIKELSNIGKQAVRTSKALNYETGKTESTKFGQVNTYHEDILKIVLGF